ncbi:MAG: LON peptidase substrate-binding domain-containing protein [Paracoccaceae bacterium]
MIGATDLPDILPLFPLPGAVLLPRGRLPLHIFEPRYLAMLDAALKTRHRLIGMVQPREARRSKREKPQLHRIGCAGRVTAFSETDDRRYMITLSGVSRFTILREVAAFSPYRQAEVSWAEFSRDLGAGDSDPGFDRGRFLDVVRRYFTRAELSADWESLTKAEPETLVNSLSALCPFAPEDKQALLEASGLAERRETLVTLMEFALRGGTAEEFLQ